MTAADWTASSIGEPKNRLTSATVWLSYDLGIRGDYEGLYAWLDMHGAKECGDALAMLQFDYSRSLPDELRSSLQERITTDKSTRVYIVYRDRDADKTKGQFVLGGRRAAAWTGYAASNADAVDEEI